MKKIALILLFISSLISSQTLYAQDTDQLVNGFIKDVTLEEIYHNNGETRKLATKMHVRKTTLNENRQS